MSRPGKLMAFANVSKFICGGGPVLLFITACAYGALGVQLSTDTWIGLAAGREILHTGFPKFDTFSYTAAGHPWYNQNWLTHVWQYWLYSHIGPDEVIWAAWLMTAAIFGLTLLSCYWRSGTWLGSIVAATVVALGCRNFVYARPATTGFFCMAAMWAMLCALEAQRQYVRWWPIVLLLPILLVWGGAHGSFTLGYAILVFYVLGWSLLRYLRAASCTITFAQLCSTGSVVAMACLTTLIFGPLGIDNFTHGEKIAGSAAFRMVAEWIPPYRVVDFPPAWPFWTILGTSVACLGLAALIRLRRSQPKGGRGVSRHRQRDGIKRARVPATELQREIGPPVGPLDPIPVLIGLAMALWARRFAPMYYIFGAPIVLTWIIRLGQPLTESWKRRIAILLSLLCWPALAITARETYTRASTELFVNYAGNPRDGLLERVTQYDKMVGDALEYLRRNDINANLFLEWTQAGLAMFYVPGMKVFIDGRSQQVYDEATYWLYGALITYNASAPGPTMLRTLDGYDGNGRPTGMARTDAVLLRRTLPFRLTGVLLASHEWTVVYASKRSILFIRRDSDAFRGVAHLVRDGKEWRPNTADATLARGEVLTAMSPPDLAAALESFEKAVELDPSVGWNAYPRIAGLYQQLGWFAQKLEYIEQQRDRLSRPIPNLSDGERQNLLRRLQALKGQL